MRDMVIYGLGELGQLYGAAALRAGLRVTPITRALDPLEALRMVPVDVPVLVAVGEDALSGVLETLGPSRGEATILLQNELFPSAWQQHHIEPTVMVPWVLKKKGVPVTVARPTPVYGRHAPLIKELHDALGLPVVVLQSERALHQALVEKYAFILTINALGLLRDRTLSLWLQEDPMRVRALALEAVQLGAVLCGEEVEVASAAAVVAEGMRALGSTGARGRTAEARVRRALEHGRRIGLELPELARAAAAQQGGE